MPAPLSVDGSGIGSYWLRRKGVLIGLSFRPSSAVSAAAEAAEIRCKVDTFHNESTLDDEFISLYSRYSRRIYSFILALTVYSQDADDVFQNTSLALWKKRGDFAPGSSFWAWSCQIAYYEVLRHRHNTKRVKVFSDVVIPQFAAHLLANEEQASLAEQSLRNCLERLSVEDRRLIELRYFQEQAPKQIAQMESRSVHSVYRALSRIHEQLHRCIYRIGSVEGGHGRAT